MQVAGALLTMYYLLKTEASAYSFSDLQRDGETVWDGVNNPVARRNLREMPVGAKLLIYHTGDEKRAVGTATALEVDVKNPKDPRVTIQAGKPVAKPKTLAEIKASPLFKDSPLVRQGRLSVVPLAEAQYRFLVEG